MSPTEDSYFEYLIQATNDIFAVLRKDPNPSNYDVGHALSIGCGTLKRLSSDILFNLDLRKVSSYKQINRMTFDRAISDIDHFVKGFLQMEFTLLTKAGISDNAADAILASAKNLRNDIRSQNIDMKKIDQSIRALKNQVCSISSNLNSVFVTEREKKRRRIWLTKAGFAIGGAATIAINASPLATNMGISQVGIALSGAIGATLLSKV